MGNIYWNSPYQADEHYDEFGYARHGRASDHNVRALIELGDRLSGRDETILIRKDYSEEFLSGVPKEMKDVIKCAVTTRDPSLSVKGMEHAVVFDFHVKIQLPPVYNSSSIFDFSISDLPPLVAPRPAHGPLERGYSVMYAVIRRNITTDQVFAELRNIIYMQAMREISKMIDKMKVEQRS